MPLNFTGRAPPEPEEPSSAPSRAPVVVLACFGVAAMLAGLVFVAALRQHKADAPPPLPALVGGDAAAQTPPPQPAKPVAQPPAPAEPAWILHKAAPTPVAEPAAPAPAAPQAQDRAQAEAAAAKARMLAALRQVPHGVITLSIEDDPLARAYGDKLKALFREAGWTVDEVSSFGTGPPRRGVAAALGVSPSGEAVREAFDVIGFQFLPPPPGVSETPELFVGVPPPARAR